MQREGRGETFSAFSFHGGGVCVCWGHTVKNPGHEREHDCCFQKQRGLGALSVILLTAI